MYDWASTDTSAGGAGTSPFTIIGGSQVTGFYTSYSGSSVTVINNGDITGNITSLHATSSASSIRFNNPAATSISIAGGVAPVHLTFGGVLVTPNMGANNAVITGTAGFEVGSRSSTTAAMVIWQNNTNGFLTIADFLDNEKGAAAGTFVFAGPGTVNMTVANRPTAARPTLNNGVTINISNATAGDAALGALATAASANLNGGTIFASDTFALDNAGNNKRPIALGNNGGTVAAATGNTMTVRWRGQRIRHFDHRAWHAAWHRCRHGEHDGGEREWHDHFERCGHLHRQHGSDSSGTLALGSTGTINGTPQILVTAGTIFDVSAMASYTLGGAQVLAGNGTINGSVTTASGSGIYAGTDGTFGTNTFNNDLTLANPAHLSTWMSARCTMGRITTSSSVGGALSLSSTTFHLKAPSTSVNLDTTHDYVLMTATTALTGTPNSTPVWDVQPANAANFIVTTSGNSVVLHHTSSAPPSGSGIASPATVDRTQSTLITVTAVGGSSPVGSVVLDASLIGGSSSMTLVRSNTSSLYTNTVTVGAAFAPAAYALPVTISDTTTPTPLTSVINVALTVVNGQTWDGLGGNANWSTGANWVSGVSPVTGDFVIFAGSTQTSPSMDSSYSLTGVAFNSTAGNFILGSPSGTLTLTANGITNSSANTETVNTPLTLTAAQTIDAASGNLTISQPVNNGGNTLSFDGGHTNVISGGMAGGITGAGGLVKNGAGLLTLSASNSYAGTTTANAGTLEVANNGVINGGAISGAGYLVDGGVVMATGTSAFNAVNNAFTETAGSVIVNAFNANANDGTLFQITGGSFSAISLTLPRTVSFATAPTATAPIAGATTSGLYINGAGANLYLGAACPSRPGTPRLPSVWMPAMMIVTNEVLVSKISGGSARWGILQVNGGSFTSQDTVNGIVIAANNAAAACDGEVYLSGGTTFAQLIAFGVSTDTVGGKGFLILNNSANLYLGSGSIVQPNTAGYTSVISLLSGTMGAQADWACAMPMQLSGGTVTFKAADASNVPHNIALDGVLSGGGALTKTGNGVVTLGAANTYSGLTTVGAGTLALTNDGVTLFGTVAGSISVSSNAIFDVTGLTAAGGFSLGSAKIISGTGIVAGQFAAMDGSTISPAGLGAEGQLSFTNGLTAQNMTFKMELSSDPTGTTLANDSVSITGDFTANGLSTIAVTPVGSLGLGTYKLIKYTGAFNGGLSALTCAAGTLTNPPGEIDLIVTSVRPVANLVWRGDGISDQWDTGISSTWQNGASLDKFYTGDTNTFDDTAVSFNVNPSGVLVPANSVILVNATHDYTFNNTGGNISGNTGLTKTNTGNLTILGNNDYTGVTTINGGTLTAQTLASGGVSSSIGAASSAATNLVLNGGTLAYLGGSVNIDRSVTLGSNGGTLNVQGGTLTLSGVLTGPGSLTKTGNSQITLANANNYLGGTVVAGGTLRGDPGATIGTNTLTVDGSVNASTFQIAGIPRRYRLR